MSARNKYALLIGINDYKPGKWDALNNPVTDVENVKKSLVRYGFDDPVILTDKQATVENIRKELDELRKKTDLEDDVFIFFAGHGELNPRTDKLELVPYDYYKGDEYVITGDQIAEYIDSMSANNVLLTLDCCFSGSIHSRLNAVIKDEEYYPYPGAASRFALTSGGEERVKDGYSGSPFTNALVDCLNFNDKPEISIIEVFAYILDELKLKYKQKPQLRHLSVKSHKSGMFSLFLNETKLSTISGEAKRLMPANSVESEYLPRTVSQFEKDDNLSVLFGEQLVRTLEALVKENSFVALIGIAGAGKTYELLHVQHRLWLERRLISIDISLDNYTGQLINSYLPSFWSFLRPDQVVLYFDGLDELPAEVFPLAIRELKDFIDKNPTVKVVISCRTNFYSLPYDKFEGTFSGVTLVSLDDISTYIMTEYVNRQIPDDKGKFVRELILNSYDDIAGKAYYFRALFNYYKKHGNLAISRSDLFDKIIEDAIDENINKYRSTTPLPLNSGQIRLILRKLAHLMARLGKRVLTDDEVYHVISDPDEKKILRYLPFIEHSMAEKLWRFEHNNIQELLSAKVLADLPADEILKRIVVKDVGMVAQYWMNTLSFVMTLTKDATRKELLDWLLQNDPDIMIRFERERIDDSLRSQIAITVFDNYTKQNIWLSSNRFNDRDLARFGNSPDFTEHLLATLENTTYSANIYGNVFRILKYYPPAAIEPQKTRWKTALYTFLKLHANEEYLMYEALYRIGDFWGNDDPVLIYQCIALLAKRKNAYIRTGLYHLIISGDCVDAHLSLICDGLNLDEIEGIEDRTTINFGSESINLTRSIQSIRKPETIKSLLSFISYRHQGGFVSGADIVDVTSAIAEVAERLFQDDNSLAQSLTDFIFSAYVHLPIEKYRHFSTFYLNTGTAITTIKHILLNAKPEQKLLVSDFVKLLLENKETLDALRSAYTSANINSEKIGVIHEMLKLGLWGEKSQTLLQFEEIFGGFPEIGLSIKKENLPAVTLEQQLNKKIGYVFDTEGLKDCFADIYNTLGVGKKTIKEVLEQSSKVREYSNLTNATFLHFYQSREAPTMSELSEWLDKSADFAIIRLRELYTILHQDKENAINLTVEQIQTVEEWMNMVSTTKDLRDLLLLGDRTDQVLWFFIKTLRITVPEKMLLAFSMYGEYSYTETSPEVLIALEDRLPEEKLRQQVIQNIEDDLPYSRWLPNVIFSLKNKITSVYPVIKTRIQEAEDYLNHAHELLEYWVEQTGDLSFIENLMLNGKNVEIRLSATTIKLNCEKDNSGTIKYLETRLSDRQVSNEEKKPIAVELIAWNSVAGLSCLTNAIISGTFDSLGQTGNFKKLTNPDCIPYLLKLMMYARQENNRNHRKDHMVGDIGAALFNIGTQSHKNYLMLKNQIEAFLQAHETTIPDLSILRVTLMNVKEAKTKDFEDFTIADFEQDFKSYTFSCKR